MTAHLPIRRRIFVLLLLLVTASVAYASFSQPLAIRSNVSLAEQTAPPDTNTDIPLPVAAPGGQVSPSGAVYSYVFDPVTINNSTTTPTTFWYVTFEVPADTTYINCWNAVCERDGNVVKASSMSYNNVIQPAGSTTFGVTLTAATANYSLASLQAYTENPNADAPVVDGLVFTVTPAGGWWDSATKFVRQYNMTVKNTGAQTIRSWKICASWDSANQHVELMWNINYAASGDCMTFSSSQQLAPGDSANWGGQIGSTTDAIWSPTYVATGR